MDNDIKPRPRAADAQHPAVNKPSPQAVLAKAPQMVDPKAAKDRAKSNQQSKPEPKPISPALTGATTKPAHAHRTLHAVLATLAIAVFGASMFLLGYSFGEESQTTEVNNNNQAVIADTSGDLDCQINWLPNSPAGSANFEVNFTGDQDESNEYRLYADDDLLVADENEVYSLNTVDNNEILLEVKPVSDVASNEVLCSYGPVLIGLPTSDDAEPV